MNEIWQTFKGFFADALRLLAEQFSFLGDHQWAVAIIALTVIVKTAMIPLAVKQIRSQRSMQRLQPEIMRLKQKYRNDRQRFAQEQMELYRREGVSPFASCLPFLPQLPVLWAMYFSIREIRVEHMPFFGLGDLSAPAKASVGGWLLIVLMTVAQIYSVRQTAGTMEPSQRKMMYVMPVIFVFIMIGFPAALVLYWAVSQLYQVGQQTIMLRKSPPPQPGAGPKRPVDDRREAGTRPPAAASAARDKTSRGTGNALDRTRRQDGRGGQSRRRRGARPT